jgi:4-carboxymuconolactone decarboxylase
MTENSSRADEGLAIRKQVLGDEYVEASRRAADEFTLPLQDFVNENCWGLVWTRPGLPLPTRSLITLSCLAGTGKWTEFKAHTRGALRNGCSPDELREAILHMSVYLGIPSGLEAFRAAASVVKELSEKEPA